ncbi:hypothetical protein CDAR_273961 [Caerostris darwini]|uniref:Uncharacterized protein n=1 Tax=Caerostris darwini TaxID=1538125 RepID=A0AAV4RHV4_9ARAC|nr:hypothetical protein CDAR_273961 [Caerostris darwini]
MRKERAEVVARLVLTSGHDYLLAHLHRIGFVSDGDLPVMLDHLLHPRFLGEESSKVTFNLRFDIAKTNSLKRSISFLDGAVVLVSGGGVATFIFSFENSGSHSQDVHSRTRLAIGAKEVSASTGDSNSFVDGDEEAMILQHLDFAPSVSLNAFTKQFY